MSIPVDLSLDIIDPLLAVQLQFTGHFPQSRLLFLALQSDRNVIESLMVVLFVILTDVSLPDVIHQLLQRKVHLVVEVEEQSQLEVKVVDEIHEIHHQVVSSFLLVMLHIRAGKRSQVIHHQGAQLNRLHRLLAEFFGVLH